MPSLRRRAHILYSGGYYDALRQVRADPKIRFHTKLTLSAYDGKPGVAAMQPHEKEFLSLRPVVVAAKRGDNVSNRKAATINKKVLNDTNILYSSLPGFCKFNKFTPAHKYLRDRWQCRCNGQFQELKYRYCRTFPERRFVRYVNNVNATEAMFLTSNRAMLRTVNEPSVIRERIELIRRFIYAIADADYRKNTKDRVGRTDRFLIKGQVGNPLSVLLAHKRALLKRV